MELGRGGPEEPRELSREELERVLYAHDNPSAFDPEGARHAMGQLFAGSPFDVEGNHNIVDISTKRRGHFGQA